MPITISDYLTRQPATSKEIQAATGLNQTAVSRQLRQLGNAVVKIPNGRSPKYALTRNAFGADDRLPLIMVDAQGNHTVTATFRPLAHGGFFIEPSAKTPKVLLGTNGDGLYDDLPYFLTDLCPQGFIGRQIARELAAKTGDFPSDPRYWNANHIGRYLIANGDDLPGNFKLGHQAADRIQRQTTRHDEHDYPILADQAINGTLPGSSAGGEQPKFTAYNVDQSVHVIVKFSPKDNSAVAQRWRDILITEYHATETLTAFDYPAAKTRLIEAGDRLFLESQRFDRIGEYGRAPMISLQTIDAEFIGLGSNWSDVMAALHNEQLISESSVRTAQVLQYFGRLINNTDMHLGNLSLGIDGDSFQLLPVYDMCSMGFAPKSSGEVAPFAFTSLNPDTLSGDSAITSEVIDIARQFWARVHDDDRISDEFRTFLDQSNPMDKHKL